MKMKIEINLDEATFKPDWKVEVDKVLNKVIRRTYELTDKYPNFTVKDTKGNIVCSVEAIH